MNSKYIHYCWFGDKPLPKLAKKCIKSWKKYLPDYEIICWNEKNVDINECPFIKGAYENKKWAFVADYARAKAMYEMGGIYFDTDMEIIAPIDFLLDKTSFLGREDSGCIACGVWGESHPKSKLSKFLLDFYRSEEGFDVNNIFNISIPKLITNYFDIKDVDNKSDDIKVLSDDFWIYPRDYFYPYSYNWQNNAFTKNTCMIHYYDATWVPKGELKYIRTVRKYGDKNANRIFASKRVIKKIIRRPAKVIFYPYLKYRDKKRNLLFFSKRYNSFVQNIDNKKDFLVFCNKDWLGTKYGTLEMFDNVILFHELYDGDNIEMYAKSIVNKKFKLLVFSTFCIGWDRLIEEIRKIDKKITIKVLWHGSNAMHGENYDWAMFYQIFKLLKEKKINSIGFVKKSMYEYYKQKGFAVEFVMNTITVDKKILSKIGHEKPNDKIKIGLYSSGNRWVKNFYNQFAGAALVNNSEIDCIPITQRVKEFSHLLNANLKGIENSISREELLIRLSKNDINLYCSFVECAPLLPLESFECGVPCITGNNHHYWEGTPLEKYLIVNKIDDSLEIYKRILYCLEHKKEIMKLYSTWKKEYDIESKKSVRDFMEVK